MATVDRNGIPLVNGILYGWAEVLVAIAGVPLTGITSVEYSDKQEVTNKYGAGRYPVGRGLGRISSEAKITLYLEEVMALQAKSSNGRLQDLGMFDVSVSYLSPAGVVVTDVVKNCHFTETSRKASEGDTDIKVDLTLTPSHIVWGAKGA